MGANLEKAATPSTSLCGPENTKKNQICFQNFFLRKNVAGLFLQNSVRQHPGNPKTQKTNPPKKNSSRSRSLGPVRMDFFFACRKTIFFFGFSGPQHRPRFVVFRLYQDSVLGILTPRRELGSPRASGPSFPSSPSSESVREHVAARIASQRVQARSLRP
jgi:hypothetical protein